MQKKKNGKNDFTGGLKFAETFKRDNLNLNVDAELKEDGTFNEKSELTGLVDGLKVKLDVTVLQKVETDTKPLEGEEEAKKVRNTAAVTLSYSNPELKVDTNLSFVKKQLNDAKLSFDLGAQVHENVAVGLKVSGKPLKKVSDDKYRKVLDTDFVLKLSTQDVSIVSALENAGSESSLSVLHNVNDKLTVGAQWKRKLGLNLPWCYKGKKEEEKSEETSEDSKEKKSEEEEKNWSLSAGFSLKSDHNTVVSGKINDKGVVSGAYEFDLKENLRATLALETNVKELGKDAKLGFSFTYSQ